MVLAISQSLLSFFVSLVVSAVVIFLAAKLFGEEEGFRTALLAAFVGSIIYSFASYFFGNGAVASVLGGIAWIIALGSLYNIGWLKSFFIALFISVFSIMIGVLFPTISWPF